MIVGTAGHIDHGKTTLVRALTGVDTDRLPEEKARGISIELGYAYAPTATGEVIGFVDVPGHEKFVQTMLAGATGIDFALLVVAADDGVMPQTREHLDILSLLGLDRGAIALTKVDAVDAARVAHVERDVRTLVARTPLADAPIFPLSGRTGEGVDALRRYLEPRASARDADAADDGAFRLAVDRVFTLAGIGTIVTGTVHSGEVAAGDRIVIAPQGREARVRSLHAQNRESERGMRGQRCALNLAGVARDEVERGDWIVAPAVALATDRLDATLTMLPGETHALATGAMVHLHVGATHAIARAVVLSGTPDGSPANSLAPGRSGVVQLACRTRIAAWRGDRLVVRNAAGQRTIGGGQVLDPAAPLRYRRTPERLAILAALALDDPKTRLAQLLPQAPFGVDLRRFARTNNLRDVDGVAQALPVRRIANESVDVAIADDRWRAMQDRVIEALAAFHRDRADEVGPDLSRLKRIAIPRLDPMLHRVLVADLVESGKIVKTGPWLHLPGHVGMVPSQERALVERVLPRLLDAPFDPPWVRDLAKTAGQPEAQVRAALMRASKRGETFQVVRDLFYHPIAIRDLARVAHVLAEADGEIRAADFRDRTGLGRKRAIQVLEFFDRVGFTRRVRDAHVIRDDTLLSVA
jgi:selenocysteine-specific elongation factor